MGAILSSLLLVITGSPRAEEANFDTSILASRGISTNIANYFSETSRFLPGRHSVQVEINGVDKGILSVRFGENGSLCIDDDFLSATGLISLNIDASEKCHNLTDNYPSASITASPNTESLTLFVPAEAMDNNFQNATHFTRGGTGALIDYNAYASKNQSAGGGGSQFSQANLETGVNIANWAIRSNSIWAKNDDKQSFNTLYTFAEHVFEKQKVRAQLGEINVNSSIFGGTPIKGIQLLDERGLQPNINTTSVSGIARTSQARVEIRQSGQLIYSSLVNAGPFTLTDVPVIRGKTDLNVSVIETDQTTTQFTIPAASLQMSTTAGAAGFAMSFGKASASDNSDISPWLYNISSGWNLSSGIAITAAGELAEKYQAMGGMFDFSLGDNVEISPAISASASQYNDSTSGIKMDLQTGITLSDLASMSLNASTYSAGYREFSEALSTDSERYQNSYSVSLSLSNQLTGNWSLQYSLSQGYGDTPDSRHLIASWSKTFSRVSCSLNWQHAMNQSSSGSEEAANDDVFYANISFPLGSQRVGTYARMQGEKQSYGLQTNGSLGQNTSYNLSVDRDNTQKSESFNSSLNTNLHYTQMTVAAGIGAEQQRNYSTSLTGGIALHQHGITFSPSPIKDTFGIARLNEAQSGIEISTPDGSVWTDFSGQAVVPSLKEWRKSQIIVNANTLPQGVDLTNGIQTVTAAYGTFSEVNFEVLNTRRVMLNVKTKDNTWLAKGLSVVDKDGNYIVSVMDDGAVFVPDASNLPDLYAVDEHMKRICKIRYTLAEEKDSSHYYEKAEGVCQ